MPLRVLLGNEFGLGNGHVATLKMLADEIRKAHPDAVQRFALRDAAAAARVGIAKSEILPTPFLKPFPAAANVKGARTYGSMFAREMLANAEAVSVRMQGWSALLSALKPDLVVAEYAPCLSCAAYGHVPVAVVGNGYSLPPPELDHFVPLVARWQTDTAEEAAQVDAFNLLFVKTGVRRLEALPQLFRADAHVLLTLPIFDPYHNVRRGDYVGVMVLGGAPSPARQQDRSAFAYFSVLDTGADGIRFGEGLLGSQLQFDAYLAGKDAAALGLPESGRLKLRKQLAQLAQALPGKSVAVHQGTLGMAAAAAFAGVPQLAIYRHDENWVNGTAIVREGLGRAIHWPEAKPEFVAERILRVAQDPAMHQRALVVAESLAPFRNKSVARDAARQILALTN